MLKSLTEFGEMVLLLVGAVVLLGALAIHAPNGWVFNAPNGGWEYPAFLSIAALTHILAGDGAFALKPSSLPQWLTQRLQLQAA